MKTTTKVDTRSNAVEAMAKPWPMIDALIGGTGAMREAGKAFLPQFPAEHPDSYKCRLESATLFPAFQRTSEVMAAKPLSKEISIDDCPESVAAYFEDVDGEGSTLHAYAHALMLQCMQPGIVGVLVDVPPAEGVKTKADEKAAGIRPYFATYKASAILGWRYSRGKLTQLRLLETVTEEDGDFGEKPVKQVRVLYPGRWEIWRVTKTDAAGNEEWTIHEDGVHKVGDKPLSRIPFEFFYGLREGLGIGKSPLLNLAYLNVKHWQSQSDQDNILHVARVPVFYAAGMQDGENIAVGANAIIKTTNTDAKFGYVEHSGAAIGAGRQSILDLEDQMRQIGAELLVQRPNVTTATQTVSEGEGNKSILQRIVENFQESLEACINLMGEWMGVPTECEVKMFTDFGALDLSGQSVNSIIAAVDKGILSKQTAFEEFKRRGLVSPESTWEEEYERISKEAMEAAANGETPEDDEEDDPPEKPKDEAEEEDGLEVENE